MKKGLFLILLLSLVFQVNIFAQLGTPEVEAVYGGRINDIAGYKQPINNYTRIFVSTESANSIFYADYVHGSGLAPMFQVIPALDATAGYGSGIQRIEAHEATGNLAFIHQTGLLYCQPPYSSVQTIYSGNVEDFIIVDSLVYFTSGPSLHAGYFDFTGNYVSLGNYPMGTVGGMVQIAVHPTTNLLYFFYSNGTPTLYKSSDAAGSITGTTTFTNIASLTLTASSNWKAMGIAPNGRIFMAGSDMSGKRIAYSDDEITWTDYSTGINGIAGSDFAFSGNSSAYHVYHASMYSNNKGITGTWTNFGNAGFQTHPNDGSTYADSFNDSLVWLTTDQGLGFSMNKGSVIAEMNDGIEAVQVNDFDMSADKNTGWAASKSGIRRVTTYLTSPTWTNAIFPNNDGSPYFSSEMNQSNHNQVFVGNVRIYRTSDNGITWSQVFTPEQSPYNFSNVGTEAQAIEICNANPNIVMAGFTQRNADKGGLFVSEDGGNNWSQILLDASATGADVDVFDIEFTLEGTDTVAYVGVEYDLSAPTGRSVYKVTKSGNTWSAAQDMTSSTTSTGSLIVATIVDIEVSTTGDTIFAVGTDAGINHPIAYYKPLNSTGLWTPFTTSGFPFSAGKKASAFTIGVDTVYCAVDNEIYVYPIGATSWTLGSVYPIGTFINVLYFDDLLAGTGTGLYFMASDNSTSTESPIFENENTLVVYPNPVQDILHLQLNTTKTAKAEIYIHDLYGRRVRTISNLSLPKGDNIKTIDLSNLPNGLYILTVQMNNEMRSVKIQVMK